MDMRSFSIAQTDLRSSLTSIEAHLRLRNFLVGHSLTLADVLLVGVLSQAFHLSVDKKTREAHLPNLTRYLTLILSMPAFTSTYGEVVFCKDANFTPAESK